jgi:hypothetical protein
VALLPYLSLEHAVRFNGLWLGPLEEFGGPWDPPELEAAAEDFAALFVDPAGQPVERPSLLARATTGADGRVPDLAGRQALMSAIGFAVVDSNPVWSDETMYESWRVATADNADLWFQPISLQTRSIATEVGSRVRTLHGGGTLDGPPISPPIELHMGGGRLKLDEELLDALHRVLTGTAPCGDSGRLGTAIRWHLKAWLNTASISDEDRILFFKVALEVLAGTDRSAEAAQYLNLMFGSVMEQDGAPIGVSDLLWSPWEPDLERSRLTRSGRLVKEQLQLFEHWFMALVDARNEIVHSGKASRLDYSEAGSPYSGPLIETADRVMREAIKVELGRCGFPRVWRGGLSRASLSAAEHLKQLLDDD